MLPTINKYEDSIAAAVPGTSIPETAAASIVENISLAPVQAQVWTDHYQNLVQSGHLL